MTAAEWRAEAWKVLLYQTDWSVKIFVDGLLDTMATLERRVAELASEANGLMLSCNVLQETVFELERSLKKEQA